MPLTTLSAGTLGSAAGSTDASAAVIAATFTDTCDILRNSPSDDGIAGQTDDWATIASGVACRALKYTREAEMVRGAQVTAIAYLTLELPLGTDLLPTDRISKDALLYEVIDTDSGLTGALFLSAILVRHR